MIQSRLLVSEPTMQMIVLQYDRRANDFQNFEVEISVILISVFFAGI